MPISCSDKDMVGIVKESSKGHSYVHVDVEAVRSHHDKFVLWLDNTFILLW